MAAAQAALTAGAVATDAVLGWTLSRETNGQLQPALIVVRAAVAAGALGIPTSLYFLYPRTGAGERSALVGQSFLILVLSGLAAACAVALGAGAVAELLNQPPEVAALLRAGAVAVAFGLPALLAEPVLIVQERAWLAAGNATLGAVVQTGAVAWALIEWRRPEAVFYALAAASAARLALPAAYTVFVSSGRFGVPALIRRSSLRIQLAVALPVGATAAIDAASTYADRAVVARLFDSAELALYRYGAQEAPFLALVLGALTPVLLPEFSAMLQGGRRQDALQLWRRASLKTAVVAFGAFWALMWVAPQFLSVLYSPQYGDAARFFRIYLLLLPLRVVAYMPMLYALGRGRFVVGVAAGEVAFSVLISVVFARQFGLAGAAWGPVLATVAQAAIYLGMIRSGLGARWREVLPWGGLLRDFAAAGLFFSPLVAMGAADLQPPVAVAGAIAWGGVYLAWYALPRLRGD